jgi:hypothetical protein
MQNFASRVDCSSPVNLMTFDYEKYEFETRTFAPLFHGLGNWLRCDVDKLCLVVILRSRSGRPQIYGTLAWSRSNCPCRSIEIVNLAHR